MKFNRQRAFHSHFGTDHPARMRALRRHRDDLFDRSSSASPTRLPLCKSAPSTTPLESTHLQVLIPHHFIRDYVLDSARSFCYPFFVLDTRSISAMWRLRILCPFEVNKCFIASF